MDASDAAFVEDVGRRFPPAAAEALPATVAKIGVTDYYVARLGFVGPQTVVNGHDLHKRLRLRAIMTDLLERDRRGSAAGAPATGCDAMHPALAVSGFTASGSSMTQESTQSGADGAEGDVGGGGGGEATTDTELAGGDGKKRKRKKRKGESAAAGGGETTDAEAAADDAAGGKKKKKKKKKSAVGAGLELAADGALGSPTSRVDDDDGAATASPPPQVPPPIQDPAVVAGSIDATPLRSIPALQDRELLHQRCQEAIRVYQQSLAALQQPPPEPAAALGAVPLNFDQAEQAQARQAAQNGMPGAIGGDDAPPRRQDGQGIAEPDGATLGLSALHVRHLATLRNVVALCETGCVHTSDLVDVTTTVSAGVQAVVQAVWRGFRRAERERGLFGAGFIGAGARIMEVRDWLAECGTQYSAIAGAFDALDATLTQCLASLLQYVDTAVVLIHQHIQQAHLEHLRQTALLDISKGQWKSYSFYFSEQRCSQGIPYAAMHLRRFMIHCPTTAARRDHVATVVAAMVARYMEIVPSFARAKQLRLDALHFTRAVRGLRNFYSESGDTPEDVFSTKYAVERSLVDLLFLGTVLTTPLPELVAFFKEQIPLHGTPDEVAERPALQLPTSLWHPTAFAGGARVSPMELASITEEPLSGCEVTLDMLMRKVTLSRQQVAEVLEKRWELWDVSPVIMEEDQPLVRDLSAVIVCVAQNTPGEFASVRSAMEAKHAAPTTDDVGVPSPPPAPAQAREEEEPAETQPRGVPEGPPIVVEAPSPQGAAAAAAATPDAAPLPGPVAATPPAPTPPIPSGEDPHLEGVPSPPPLDRSNVEGETDTAAAAAATPEGHAQPGIPAEGDHEAATTAAPARAEPTDAAVVPPGTGDEGATPQ